MTRVQDLCFVNRLNILGFKTIERYLFVGNLLQVLFFIKIVFLRNVLVLQVTGSYDPTFFNQSPVHMSLYVYYIQRLKYIPLA